MLDDEEEKGKLRHAFHLVDSVNLVDLIQFLSFPDNDKNDLDLVPPIAKT
jgi:hypothetical protein